jgi:hypothetical protein
MKTTIKLLVLMMVFALPVTVSAQDAKQKKLVNKTVRMSTPKAIEAFPEDMLSENMKNAKKVSNTEEAALVDGIVYTIIASTNTMLRDCFSCGPAVGTETNCNAKYTVETRTYTEWKDGVAVRTWTQRVSVFMGCGQW